MGIGMLLPLLLASGPRYRGTLYPDRLAGAGAFCTRGIFLGMMLGVPVSLGVYEASSLGAAWITVGVSGVLFYIGFVIADRLGRAKLAARQGQAAPPLAVLRKVFQSGALEEREFKSEIAQMLTEILLDRNYSLWSSRDQALVRAQLRAAFPKLQPWSDADGGFQHNMGVARQLRQLGENEELELLQELAPGVGLVESGTMYTDGHGLVMNGGQVPWSRSHSPYSSERDVEAPLESGSAVLESEI